MWLCGLDSKLHLGQTFIGPLITGLMPLPTICTQPLYISLFCLIISFQNAIANHESNGLDIIIALILNDINPLGKERMDLVLELKNNASKLLLAIMESRHDSENADRILYNMSPKHLVCISLLGEGDDRIQICIFISVFVETWTLNAGTSGLTPQRNCLTLLSPFLTFYLKKYPK